jgi:hypothetical protein
MRIQLDRRNRFIRTIDALTLAKLTVLAVGAFVGTAAPLYLIGIVFWVPILAAAILFSLRWLGALPIDSRRSGGMRELSARPPARLGLPLSVKLARASSDTESMRPPRCSFRG